MVLMTASNIFSLLINGFNVPLIICVIVATASLFDWYNKQKLEILLEKNVITNIKTALIFSIVFTVINIAILFVFMFVDTNNNMILKYVFPLMNALVLFAIGVCIIYSLVKFNSWFDKQNKDPVINPELKETNLVDRIKSSLAGAIAFLCIEAVMLTIFYLFMIFSLEDTYNNLRKSIAPSRRKSRVQIHENIRFPDGNNVTFDVTSPSLSQTRRGNKKNKLYDEFPDFETSYMKSGLKSENALDFIEDDESMEIDDIDTMKETEKQKIEDSKNKIELLDQAKKLAAQAEVKKEQAEEERRRSASELEKARKDRAVALQLIRDAR